MDGAAFAQLVAPHIKTMRRQVRRRVRDPHDAEDCLQDALLRAWRAIDRYRGDASIGTWLCAIAINCARVAQPQMQQRTVGGLDLDRPHHDTPEALAIGEDVRVLIRQALWSLPTEQRDALIRYELDEQRYQDIAAAHGCPVNTVRTRIFRAREAIAEAIA